jgi:hypothetical protein
MSIPGIFKDPYETYYPKKFGITYEQYKLMLQKQHRKCSICNKAYSKGKTNFAVDHNHTTGQIRGLLCSNCNSGLGLFRESPKILLKAIRYIKKWSKRCKNP